MKFTRIFALSLGLVLVIKPAEWTGSDLDVVSLFQYNLGSGSGNPSPGYIPVLVSEESINR